MLIKKVKIPFMSVATTGLLPSCLKKTLYRMKGYTIGKNVSIGPGSVIIGKKVVIGDHVKIGLVTIIRGEEVVIERYAAIGSFTVVDSGKIHIGEDARINEQVIVGGMKTPQSRFTLGKRTIIMEYSFINTTLPVEIGDDTGIGGHCLLFTHGSWLNQLEGFPVTFAPITIGKSVWLPWRVFIMPGVSIGDKVVIGANSLVAKSVGPNCLIAGSPAKVIKENYPALPTEEQKLAIFDTFMKDFFDFLIYYGFQPARTPSETGYIVRNTNGNATFEVDVRMKPGNGFSYSGGDRLVISNIDAARETLPASVPAGLMILDMERKQRLGTSDIGEEFGKFVSRYGVRFERLD